MNEPDSPAWIVEMTYVVFMRDARPVVWRVNRGTGWVASDASGWREVGTLPYSLFVEGLDNDQKIVTREQAMIALRELGAESDELDLTFPSRSQPEGTDR